jgi:cytochrome o ubiquinol oxidase subunit 2
MTNKKHKVIIYTLPIALIVAITIWYLRRHNIAVLNPAGQIARKERQLFFIALGLSAIVAIPVYIMTVAIALRYREDNPRPKRYMPDWNHSRPIEALWWGIPCVIILALSIITWNSSHALDPYKPISSTVPAMTVQVVALDWKWLFIYPAQHVASINLLELPVGTPVDFQITSDTVMNSFWIPNLGGQIYAMPGMNTQLHLIADKAGNFPGSSANISGSGFASMAFTAKARPLADFKTWVNTAQQSPRQLTMTSYNQLARPSQNNQTVAYSNANPGLFDDILFKYMAPGMNMSGGLSSTATANQMTSSMEMQ